MKISAMVIAGLVFSAVFCTSITAVGGKWEKDKEKKTVSGAVISAHDVNNGVNLLLAVAGKEQKIFMESGYTEITDEMGKTLKYNIDDQNSELIMGLFKGKKVEILCVIAKTNGVDKFFAKTVEILDKNGKKPGKQDKKQ